MATSKRDLPEGWRIEGMWYGIASGNPDFREVHNQRDITDSDIQSADRIVVSYTSRRTGNVDYRTIAGAMSKKMIGNIIKYTTRVVSPVGGRS